MESIVFPEITEDAIDEVLASNDPLDSKNFDVVEYINNLFPSEESLGNIDSTLANLNVKLKQINKEIKDITYEQARFNGEDGVNAIEDAQLFIQQLFSKISDIKTKAILSDEMVQEITRDIKSLDFAKRNLTASINSLNRLHMLIAGVESLKNMSEKRQYRDAAYLLQALNHIIPEFDRFSDMKKIKEIYDEFRKTQILLKRQIREEFSDFCSTKQTVFTVEVKKLLHDACLVLEALGEEVVADLVDWLIRLELNEYKIIFSPNSEASDLNKVKRRYTWCKRVVSNFEECWADVFPASWKLSKKLFLMFCAWCRKDLSNLLKQNEDSLSVKLLLLLIGETLTFEKHLATRFPTFPEAKETEFEGIISSCFEAYMNIYVEAQEKILSTLVEEAVSDAKKTQKSFPVEKNALLSLGTAKVLSSSSELFLFYKDCFLQCSLISNKETMYQLFLVFSNYLNTYLVKVLRGTIPYRNSLLTALPINKLSFQDFYYICSLLNTADYIIEMLQQLEIKFKEKIDKVYVEKINLTKTSEVVYDIISEALQVLLRSFDTSFEDVLSKIKRISWSTLEVVGDCSGYVESFYAILMSSIPIIREGIDKESQKYLNNICLKLANTFISSYTNTLYQCQVSIPGAEQMLLDCHQIKQYLLKLHNIDFPENSVPIPSSYSKYISKVMNKLELSLKVLMSAETPVESFVINFIDLHPENDSLLFRKLLSMKGYSKSEEQILLDRFTSEIANSNSLKEEGKEENEIDCSVLKRLEDFIKNS